MDILKGIAAGVVVMVAVGAGETRVRVSRPAPTWWGEIGRLWSSRAWEAGAPSWGRPIVWSAAREAGVPAEVIAAVIHVESRWRADAVSQAGAIGLMQLMPGTASDLGVDPWDPAENVRAGARYLRALLDRFGTIGRALAAYNAGPKRAAAVPAAWPSETRAYVAAVLRRLPEPLRERL